MRSDLATLVTGDPRTGTALLMRTLDLLGVPVAGHKFHFSKKKPDRDDFKRLVHDGTTPEEIDRIIEQAARGLNPLGFYEIPGVVMGGFQKLTDATRGKAVKIMAVAAYPRETMSGVAMGTPVDLVDRFILCLRHPRHIAQSQMGLLGLGMQAGEDGWELTKYPLTPIPYLRRMAGFCNWLGQVDDEDFAKFLPVDFVEMIAKPAEMIEKIVAHLSVEVDGPRMELAIANVNPKLERSNEFHTWPEKISHQGEIADSLYEALRSLDRGKIQAAALWAIDYLAEDRHEGAVWCDDADTWATIRPRTARRILQNDRGLADKMRESLARYRRTGLICDLCQHYARDPEKTYTIARPTDFGELVRPMVFCGRDKKHKTVEACKHCWQRGSIVNGEVKGAQRTNRTQT